MFKICHDGTCYDIEWDGSSDECRVNGEGLPLRIHKKDEAHWLVFNAQRTYDIELVSVDAGRGIVTLAINGIRGTFDVKDRFDLLLDKLGMDRNAEASVKNLKAPMPGLILDVMVAAGGLVKKGDALLMLEAMKMENILRSPIDGVVKEIAIQKGTAVEKNEVLLTFE